MFNINGWELAIILVLALILFGPERLPEAAAQAGRAWRQLQGLTAGATAELTRELQAAVTEAERAQEMLTGAVQELDSAADTVAESLSATRPPAGRPEP